MNKRNYFLVLAILLTVILGSHIFHLADIPSGFYLDETSIGYNAALVAQAGVDEHNILLPIYFKAFGEYKNPIYIYTTALIFRIFGVSEFNLRFTSFLFYTIALVFHALLISKLFNRNKTIQIYAFLSFGFLPIFFVLSRISFELISQLTWICAINLVTWRVFWNNKEDKPKTLESLINGLILGTSIYTYSTARLLSLLTLVLLWVVFLKKENIKKLILISLAFLVSLLPYITFTISNPGATTKRFLEISYIDDPISPIKKVFIFFRNLSEYWSLDFLVVNGDSNLRHSTGYGGILFFSIFILFLIGLLSIFYNKKLHRFHMCLLSNLVVSPVAAALTLEGTPHALRSLLLGYYIVLISCYGVDFIINIPSYRLKKMISISITSLFIIEILSYQLHYFLIYPSTSIRAMESFDFRSALQTAINQNPKQIIFMNDPYASYVNLRFYQYVVKNPHNIPIFISQDPTQALGSCILYHRKDDEKLSQFPYSFNEYESKVNLNILQRIVSKEPAQSIMKVRCYEEVSKSQLAWETWESTGIK